MENLKDEVLMSQYIPICIPSWRFLRLTKSFIQLEWIIKFSSCGHFLKNKVCLVSVSTSVIMIETCSPLSTFVTMSASQCLRICLWTCSGVSSRTPRDETSLALRALLISHGKSCRSFGGSAGFSMISDRRSWGRLHPYRLISFSSSSFVRRKWWKVIFSIVLKTKGFDGNERIQVRIIMNLAWLTLYGKFLLQESKYIHLYHMMLNIHKRFLRIHSTSGSGYELIDRKVWKINYFLHIIDRQVWSYLEFSRWWFCARAKIMSPLWRIKLIIMVQFQVSQPMINQLLLIWKPTLGHMCIA